MFILKISSYAFVKSYDDDEGVEITSNYEKAMKFNKIGDAIRAAVDLNTKFEDNIVSVIIL